MSSNAASMAVWSYSSAARHERDVELRARQHDRSAIWAGLRRSPGVEAPRSRDLAHLGGFTALLSVVGYLAWRISHTLPSSGGDRVAAWVLVAFEAAALVPTTWRLVRLWDVGTVAPAPVKRAPGGMRVVTLVTTHDEAAEVLAPTVAAACAVEPAHETWVLDDGDRPWVEDLCRAYGARYVSRAIRHQERTGSVNNALTLMAREATEGVASDVDLIAIVRAGDVPASGFLTATLGWFADPEVASVQVRRTRGLDAWDTDATTGLVSNGQGTLYRTQALREIGGLTPDDQRRTTSAALVEAGWRTERHEQALLIGTAPATTAEYVARQHRRATTEGSLLSALTLLAMIVPAALLVWGAETSTAAPLTFAAAFTSVLAVRTWGTRRLQRTPLTVTDQLAHRVVQVSAAVSGARSMFDRRTGQGQDADVDHVVRVAAVIAACLALVLAYAVGGLAGALPWRASEAATVASSAWLVVALVSVIVGAQRLRVAQRAFEQTDTRLFRVGVPVTVDGFAAELVDLAVDGATVRLPLDDWPGSGTVELALPGTGTATLLLLPGPEDATDRARPRSLRTLPRDWTALRALSLFLFHTPPHADLPLGLRAVASPTMSPTTTRPMRVVHP